MKNMKRRDFLKLTRDASICALIPHTLKSVGAAAPRLMKYAGVDLDQADYYVTELQSHFERGNMSHVLKEASRYFNILERAAFPVEMTRATESQMRFGMLFAQAQECMLPWYERATPAVNTYNHIETTVLPKLPLRSYPLYHAQLLARQAPLYREMGNLEKSLKHFGLALDHCLRHGSDSDLLVELCYSRAHVWAVTGDERRWQADLNRAKEHAQKADPARSNNLFRLIMYTEGEGYKRLAYNMRLDLPLDRRRWYAAHAITCFQQSHMEQSQWSGHAILSGVAEAQCLILMDADEAIRRSERLRVEAQRIYPAIVQKIDRTVDAARQRL